jgi:transcriptional regulator NrdR family protein
MLCPYCRTPEGNSYKTKILETRTFWNPERSHYFVERRHKCKGCEEEFWTVEKSPTVKE